MQAAMEEQDINANERSCDVQATYSRSGGNVNDFEPGIMSRADHCGMSGELAAACGLLFTQ